MDEQEKYERARRRIADLKGFYVHALVFVVVNTGLAGLNVALGAPYWFIWVLFGWGIGLAFHAILIFGGAISGVSRWEARKLATLMNQDDPNKLRPRGTTKPRL